MKGMVAVTGARGLIGKYIVEYLLDMGWHVRVLSRQADSWKLHDHLAIIQGDLNEIGVLESLLDGTKAVFHCAAELHDETKMYDVNVKGTQVLIDAIKKAQSIQYFCHVSSAGVVGPVNHLIIDEDTYCEPNNTYEKSKYEAEQLVLNAGLAANVCVLRPANVFDESKLGVLCCALNQSFKDTIAIFVKGNEGAHLVHAKDVAAVAIFFMGKTLKQPEVFFVSYDDEVKNTVLGVYSTCCAAQQRARVKVAFALPNTVPYCIRKFRLGKSLHGRVRFSEKKLKQAGFKYPLGFQRSISDACGHIIHKQ